MHVVSSTTTNPAPRRKSISRGAVDRLRWEVFGGEVDFFFEVSDVEGRLLHADPGEYATAPKAERAAKQWCEAYVPAAEAAGLAHEEVGALPAPTAAAQPDEGLFVGTINGWRITQHDDRGGTYQARVLDEDGTPAPEEFRGFETGTAATGAAWAWAEANPSPAEVARRAAESPTHTDLMVPPETLDDVEPVEEAPLAASVPVETPAPTPAPTTPSEVEQLRAELDRVKADLFEVTAKGDDYLDLRNQRDSLIARIATLKAELKSVEAQMDEHASDAARQAVKIRKGERPTYQQRLTFAESLATRETVGSAAANKVRELSAKSGLRISSVTVGGKPVGPHTWAFNGVDFQIEHEMEDTADGERWTTWLKGHRSKTEGHGFTYEQAVEATKTQASVVFADADPGQLAASPDTGPVADGVRLPAKRGRKPKLGKHDQAAVLAAVEKHQTITEAAIDLGCTPQQLVEYAEKADLVLSKHQGRKANERSGKRGSRG